MLLAFTVGQRWITGRAGGDTFILLVEGLREGPSGSLFGFIDVGTELLMWEQGECSRVTVGGGSGAESLLGQENISCHSPELPCSVPGLLMCSPGGKVSGM